MMPCLVNWFAGRFSKPREVIVSAEADHDASVVCFGCRFSRNSQSRVEPIA